MLECENLGEGNQAYFSEAYGLDKNAGTEFRSGSKRLSSSDIIDQMKFMKIKLEAM
jgi:hypothetical protein